MPGKSFSATLLEIPKIFSFLRLSVADFVPEESIPFYAAFEEILTNIIHHGYQDRGGTITVCVTRKEDSLFFVVRDCGIPFNPLLMTPPLPPQSLEKANPQGMGIPIYRAVFSNISYERTGRENLLKFSYFTGK